MDGAALTTLISNLGFPIACCCYLFYSNEKLRGVLEQNTKAIESLKSLITVHNAEYNHNKED